jgi:hypothetical protein
VNQMFQTGQIVILKADPSRQGPVIAVLPGAAVRIRYRVFHSPSDTLSAPSLAADRSKLCQTPKVHNLQKSESNLMGSLIVG